MKKIYSVLVALVLATASLAQATVFLSPIGNGQQFFLPTGLPNTAGLIYTYAAGTTTPTATYTTSVGNVANANPIVMTASGTLSSQIWFTGGVSYKYVIKDASGNTLLTLDNLPAINDTTTLAGSAGDALIGHIDSGTNAVVTTVQDMLRRGEVNAFSYMTAAEVADTKACGYSYDLTTKLTRGYAAANSLKAPFYIPAGCYKITSSLAWQYSVDVRGASQEFTIINKYVSGGDFDGIVISAAAQQSKFSDFRVTTTGSVGTGNGIKVTASARMLMDRITVDTQGGNGLYLYDSGVNGQGVFSNFRNLSLNSNVGDGLKVEKFYASYFENLNLNGNTGYGFDLVQGNSHIAKALVTESNVAGGAYIGLAVANSLEVYGEANTGVDLQISSSATRTEVLMYHSGGVSDVSDEGTNSIVREIGTFPMVSSPTIGRIPRTTNTTGRDLSVVAGLAGPGAAGHAGGVLALTGGGAAGNTIAAGGNVTITGGEGIAGGDGGAVNISGGTPQGAGAIGGMSLTSTGLTINSGASPITLNNTGTGGIRVNRTDAIGASVAFDLQGVLKVLKLNSMTTTNRDALTAVEGMVVENSTTHKLNFYNGSAWVEVTSP